MSGATRKDDLYLVWFDGEEAFRSLVGEQRDLWKQKPRPALASDGTLLRLKALINVDMIATATWDPSGDVFHGRLRNLVWQTAAQFGYGRYFLDEQNAVEDDHAAVPAGGRPALDLIDFDYGPA